MGTAQSTGNVPTNYTGKVPSYLHRPGEGEIKHKNTAPPENNNWENTPNEKQSNITRNVYKHKSIPGKIRINYKQTNGSVKHMYGFNKNVAYVDPKLQEMMNINKNTLNEALIKYAKVFRNNPEILEKINKVQNILNDIKNVNTKLPENEQVKARIKQNEEVTARMKQKDIEKVYREIDYLIKQNEANYKIGKSELFVAPILCLKTIGSLIAVSFMLPLCIIEGITSLPICSSIMTGATSKGGRTRRRKRQ